MEFSLQCPQRAETSWSERISPSKSDASCSQCGSAARSNGYSDRLLAVSRSHRHQVIDVVKSRLGLVTEVPCGSVGAKIGLLRSGQADAYVEPSSYTSKWDVCGAEAILRGAGGFMSDMAGGPMGYEGLDIRNRRGFVATNRACHGDVLAAIPQVALEQERAS